MPDLSFLRAKIADLWLHSSHTICKSATLRGLPLLLYYLLRLWYHGLAYDPDFLDFTASVATLVALIPLIGLQTERGRDVARELGQLVGLNHWWQNSKVVCLMIWLFVAVMYGGLHVWYPYLAHNANIRGSQALQNGEYSVAIAEFRWAVSLSPQNAQAHYNLGNSYQALHDDESALYAYQVALVQDDGLWEAYNNLGQLYLSAFDDPDAALLTLQAGLTKAEDSTWQALLRKNIGWAYLAKGLPHAALAELSAAREQLEGLDDEEKAHFWLYLAETYRLTALTYEKLIEEKPNHAEADRWRQEIQPAWIQSEAYAQALLTSSLCQPQGVPASFECLNARIWATEARERME